jgi:hypothetical protein
MGAEPGVLVFAELTGAVAPTPKVRGRVPPSLNVCPCPVIVKCAVGAVTVAVTVMLAVLLPPLYVAVTVVVVV